VLAKFLRVFRGDPRPQPGPGNPLGDHRGFVLPLSPFWAIPFALTFVAGAVSLRRPTPEAAACLAAGDASNRGRRAVGLRPRGAAVRTRPGPGLAGHRRCARPSPARNVARCRAHAADAGGRRLLFPAGPTEVPGSGRGTRPASRPGESLALFFDCRPMNAYLKEPAEVDPGRRPGLSAARLVHDRGC
jgi:hypothetical protein